VEELLSVEEAAAKLKMAPKTLRDWLRNGKLAAVKLGKHWLIREQDLGATVEAQNLIANVSLEREHNERDRKISAEEFDRLYQAAANWLKPMLLLD
jgi:excisionase family DNA binding protein